MRFAVHRPASAVASPRFHGVPRRDVPCRVHISVADVATGHAQVEGLALAALPCDMPARRAALARESGWYLLDPAGGLVLKTTDQEAPARPLNAPVEAGFLCDVMTGSVCGSPRRAGHVSDAEVLHADNVKPSRQVSGDLLTPVLSPCNFMTLQPGGSGLDPAASARAALRPRELPRQCAACRPFAGRGAWAPQEFPGRQRGTNGDATVNAYDLFSTWPVDQLRQVRECDMPPADLVASDPVGLRVLRHGARPAEAHPARLRNLDLGPVPVEATHITGAHCDDPESLVTSSLPPRRMAVRSGEEPLHRLGVVANRLLLHDYASLGEPRIIRAGRRQLAAPFDPARHPPAVASPPGLLLHAQVPHISGVRAVSQQHGLLVRSRLKSITRHTNILASRNIGGHDMRNSLPHVAVRLLPRRTKRDKAYVGVSVGRS